MRKCWGLLDLLLAAAQRRGWIHAGRVTAHIVSLACRRAAYVRRGQTRLFGFQFGFDSPDSLEGLLHEHFAQNVFFFHAATPDPVILDVGANVGDTVLYFKHLYPRATIYAFEPLPDAFRLLTRNVEANRLAGVRCFQEALADRDGTMEMYYLAGTSYALSGADRGLLTHLGGDGQALAQRFRGVTVPCRRFRDRLADLNLPRIDLLKLDVEGAEVGLLADIEPWLPRIQRIVLEFHLAPNPAQNSFDRLAALLLASGFRLQVFGDLRAGRDDDAPSGSFYISAARSDRR
jgi:FkbM family methyltransferase